MAASEHSERARRLWADPAYREKVRAERKAQWQRPEYRTKRLALCKSADYRARMKAALDSPEIKAKRSANAKRVWADPASRESRSAKLRAAWARRKQAKENQPQPSPPPPPAVYDPMTKKMRKCLGGCDRMFMSAHAGNRICYSCKARI